MDTPVVKKTKICPFCKETVLVDAMKCKHCGSVLDGSEHTQKVAVTAVDPFASLHSKIQGKKAGKLTPIGYLGIALGVLFMVVSLAPQVGTDEAVLFFIVGAGTAAASYLWVRRK